MTSVPAVQAGSEKGRSSQIAAGMAVMVTGCLPSFATAALATRTGRDFIFGETELGIAIAVFYVACTVLSAPGGRLVSAIGPRRAVWIGAGCTMAGCLGIAVLAQSAAALVILLAITSGGNALATPVASGLFQSELSPQRYGVAFGMQQAGAPAGALVAGLMLPLIAIPLGWRWGYVLIAVAALLAALSVRPREAYVRKSVIDGNPVSVDRRVRATVWLLAVVAALASAASMAMISFLVLYSVENGISESGAGFLLGLVSGGAVVSRIALGLYADRSEYPPLGIAAAMMAVSAFGYLALISGTPAVIVAGALLAGSLGWAWPGTLTLACVRIAPQAGPWAVGVMMSGLFAGCVIGPLTAGVLAESDAFAAVWWTAAAFALGAALIAGTVRKRAAAPV